MSQSVPSLKKRSVEIEVILGQGDFGASGNTRTFRGLAAHVLIRKPGLPDKNHAQATIFGMARADMEQLTRLSWEPLQSQRNILIIRAGEENSIHHEVFRGEISNAHAVFYGAPDVYMRFEAYSGFYPQLIASPPLSVQGEAEAAQLVSQFAGEAGYTFENKGVTSSVRNSVFNGSPIHKAMAVAEEVQADLIIDDNVVILKNRNQATTTTAINISPDNGMFGYPEFTQDGIRVACLFKPELQFGGLIQVTSDVPRASGTWRITNLSHLLSSYDPEGGPWESHMDATYV